MMICGLLNATICILYVLMQVTGGPVLASSWTATIVLIGRIALVTGICTTAVALVRPPPFRSWPLALNGLFLAILGLIQSTLIHTPISILTFAVLVMAMSITLAAFNRKLAAPCALLVLVSLAMGLHWIPLSPGSHFDLLWFAAYFALAALALLEKLRESFRVSPTIST